MLSPLHARPCTHAPANMCACILSPLSAPLCTHPCTHAPHALPCQQTPARAHLHMRPGTCAHARVPSMCNPGTCAHARVPSMCNPAHARQIQECRVRKAAASHIATLKLGRGPG
eukprot:365996-Chlamydomonas_euryale.AAC.13